MGAVKKATRKFEKKHLKRTLDDRKEKKKIKQQFALRDKKKSKRTPAQGETEESSRDGAQNGASAPAKPSGSGLFEDMTVEQFFQGGFEIPEAATDKTKKKKEKPQPQETRKSTKRKRSQQDADEKGRDTSQSGSSSEAEDEEGDDELVKHKRDIEGLAEKDPEFYKYLKENDADLLDFSAAESDDLAGVDELSEGETEGSPSSKKPKKSKKAQDDEDDDDDDSTAGERDPTAALTVKISDVKKWKEALIEKKSLRALRQVVLAFRAAVHTNDIEGDANSQSNGYKYEITNAQVYHELLILALRHIPDVLNHHLPVKESATGRIRVATETKKYRTLTPLLKSHASSLLHILGSLTDAPTQKLVMNSIAVLTPYFLSFRKFLKSFLQAVVEVWSTNTSDEATRITAFLLVRKVAVIGDEGLKEMCLKALYAGFVKASRQTTIHTIQGINLMKNSASEVVGLPGMEKVGYQAGFNYIRQLAVHLRNSITHNSQESYKTVYNWQYAHCLDFWSRALAMHCDGLKEAQAGKESTLRPLIYPLVQVTLGAIRLIPTAQYFPLRFFLIRSLLRLSLATGVYIPLAPLIFEVLSSGEFKKHAKPSTLKPLDFTTNIRAPKSYLRTKTYQDGIAEQVTELLSEFYALYSKSVAYPELAVPTVVMLKRHIKKSKNAKVNSSLGLLVSKLDQNSKWIVERRNKIEFSPNQREEVDGFLKDIGWEETPLGAYVVSQRSVKEQRRKLLEESERKESARRQKSRKDEQEEDSGDEMALDESEDEDEDIGDGSDE